MIRRPLASALSLALLAILAAHPRATAGDLIGGMAPSHDLDGQQYVGEVGAKGSEKGDADTLSFAGGRFRSSACDARGFGSAPYVSIVKAGVTRVITETVSPTEGKMAWKLAIEGDSLTGTAILKYEKQPATEYWVKATRKKK